MSDIAPRRPSRLSRAHWLANGLGAGLLAVAIAFRPASAPVLVALALPLALALVAARRGAGLVARGWAIGANVFVGLACAALLAFAGMRLLQGEAADSLAAAALFAPVLVLCTSNVRALVGP